VRVCFEDEAPAIGSGWRGVTIESVGPKWARIRETATGTPAKLRRAVWDVLHAHAARTAARKANPATKVAR
jgi:hypothetical protein